MWRTVFLMTFLCLSCSTGCNVSQTLRDAAFNLFGDGYTAADKRWERRSHYDQAWDRYDAAANNAR